MNERFISNGLSLACQLASPSGALENGPPVILCHRFPIASLDAQRAGGTFPQLMDRVANEIGCIAMTFNFRGCGGVRVTSRCTAGLTICVAADDPLVSAAGLLSPRADFDDWAEHPRRFLEHARDIGAIHSRDFPPSVKESTASSVGSLRSRQRAGSLLGRFW